MRRPHYRTVLFVVPLFGLFTVANAQAVWLERGYIPTETIRVVPTVRLYPTSYAFPTSNYQLTETAYIVPTTATTIMVRPRRYFARRPVFTETRYYSNTIVPTVYMSPGLVETSYGIPVVTTSMSGGLCCETSTELTRAPTTAPQSALIEERPPARLIESVPSSNPEPSLKETQARAKAAKTPIKSQPSSGGYTTSPPPQAAEKVLPDEPVEASPPSPEKPAGGLESERDKLGDPVPPALPRSVSPKNEGPAPLPGADLPAPTTPSGDPNSPGEYTRRDSRKPSFSTVSQGKPVAGRTLLEGRVVSEMTRQPLEGVNVLLSDRLGRFERTARSDFDGRYRLSLPDGDWRVQVTSNSGRLYEVSLITVAGGQITDSEDRPVGGLLISR